MTDQRHLEIGGRHRAVSRYYMLRHRVNNSHVLRNKCYRDVLLLISKEEFVEWFMPKDFKGCSVDRIDPSGDYVLDNMQVIPLEENIAKDRLLFKDGLRRCYRCHKWKDLCLFVVERRRKFLPYSTTCKECEKQRKSTGK